jgi:hypothetical protein
MNDQKISQRLFVWDWEVPQEFLEKGLEMTPKALAKNESAEAPRINPNFSVDAYAKRRSYKVFELRPSIYLRCFKPDFTLLHLIP